MEFLKKSGFWTGLAALFGGGAGLVAALWLGWFASAPYYLEVRQQSSHSGFATLTLEREGEVEARTHRFPVRQSSHPLRYRVPVAAGAPLTALELGPNLANTENWIHRLRLLGPGGEELAAWEGAEVEATSEKTDMRTFPGGWFVGSADIQHSPVLRLKLVEALEVPPVPVWTLTRFALAAGVGLVVAVVAGFLAALAARLIGDPVLRSRFGGKTGMALLLLLLSLPLFYSWARGGASPPVEWVMEFRSEVPDRAQVYFNDGRGWREFYSVIQPLAPTDDFIERRLPLTHRKVEGLRFDPFMGEGVLWLRSVRLQRGDRVIRVLDPADWEAAAGIASVEWVESERAWRMEMVPGTSDPHFFINLDQPIPGQGLFSTQTLSRLLGGVLLVAASGWILMTGMRRGWLRYRSRQGLSPSSVAIAATLIVLGSWGWIQQNDRVRVSFWVQPSVSGEAVFRFEAGRGWEPLRQSKAALEPWAGGQEVNLAVPSGVSPAVLFTPLRTHVASGPVDFRVGEVRRGWFNPWSERSEVLWVQAYGREEGHRIITDPEGRTIYQTERRRGEFPYFLVALEPTPRGSALAGPVLRPGTKDRSFARSCAGVLFGFAFAAAVGLAGTLAWALARRLGAGMEGQRWCGWLDRWSVSFLGPERAPVGFFLVNGLVFGALFLVVTPPYQAPDEPRNFHRAWHVASGHPMPLIDGGDAYGEIPLSLSLFRQVHMQLALNPDTRFSTEDWRRMASVPLYPTTAEWQEIVEAGWLGQPPSALRPIVRVDLSDTIYLSPLPYLGSAAGIRLAALAEPRVLTVHYMGRLGNLLLALVLGVLVLRYAPHWRYTLAVVMLTPMSLFLMASNSHDTVTHALGFLLLALVLRLRSQPEGSLRWWSWWPAALLFPLLVFSKINYILLFPLLLLVPWTRFQSWRGWLGGLAGVATVLVVAVLSWAFYYAERPVSEWERPQVDREAQRELILQYPLAYAEVLYQSFRFTGERWMEQMIGLLGWLDTDPGAGVRLLWGLAIGLALLVDGSRWRAAGHRWRWWERAGIIVVVAYSAVAIVSIFFLTWTEPYSLVIQGAQGRYFLPLLPWVILALALPWILSRRTEAVACLSLRVATPVFLGLTTWALWTRYWG